MKKLEAVGRAVPMLEAMLAGFLMSTPSCEKMEPPSIAPRNTLNTSQTKKMRPMRRSRLLREGELPCCCAILQADLLKFPFSVLSD